VKYLGLFDDDLMFWLEVEVLDPSLCLHRKPVSFGQCLPNPREKHSEGIEAKSPIASFLFLLVIEGTSASIWKVEELGEIMGFNIGDFGQYVSNLQYVDDTFEI